MIMIPIYATFLTIVGSVGLWVLNERARRNMEEKKRREDRYILLMNSLRGFYETSVDSKLKEEFISQVNLAWLYCPDEVIRAAYNFLDSVHTDTKKNDSEKNLAVGNLILAIRKDMASGSFINLTELKASDFKHLRAT